MHDSNTPDNNLTQESDYDKHAEKVGYVLGCFSIPEEWGFWAKKSQLLAEEAIPLMNGLNPGSWQEYKKGIRRLPGEKSEAHVVEEIMCQFRVERVPGDMVYSIERSLRFAENEGFNNKTPIEWLAWGREHDLDKPIIKSEDWLNVPDVCMFKLFEAAVNAVSGKSINSRTTEKEQDDSWKEMAREKADLIYQKQKAIGCDPSKKDIASMIAKEFEREGIKTIKEKRLNDEYIVRHAINTWRRSEK